MTEQRRTTRTLHLWALTAATAVLALSACGTQGAPEPGAASATSSESSTPSVTPSAPSSPTKPTSAAPVTGEVVLDGSLPAGQTPQIAYLEPGAILHLPDGSTRQVAQDYLAFALAGDLLAGAWYEEDGSGASHIDLEQEGQPVQTLLGEGLVQSISGETIAWNGPDQTIQSAWDGGQVEMARKIGQYSTVTAVDGVGTCYEAESPVGGCTVYYSPAEGPARFSHSHGIDDIVGPKVFHVADVASDGATAVGTKFFDEGSCWAVKAGPTGKFLWETCDHSLLLFSPGGDLVLATDAYLDGLGPSTISILDARTGAERASFRAPNGYIAGWTWEGPETALIETDGQQDWRLIRINSTGGAETALVWDGENRDELGPPWTLAIRPN